MAASRNQQHTRQALLDLLNQHGQLTMADLRQHLNCESEAISPAIYVMLRRQEIARNNTRGPGRLYRALVATTVSVEGIRAEQKRNAVRAASFSTRNRNLPANTWVAGSYRNIDPERGVTRSPDASHPDHPRRASSLA